MQFMKKHKRLWITLAAILLSLALLITPCAIYLGNYYHADMEAVNAFLPLNTVEMETLEEGTVVFAPETANTGIIFYPGGKVEHTAYIPLMKALASNGILCILVEMPFRLAVFDINAADGFQERYPTVQSWYIGGHSLGGSMAAAYLATHTDAFDGLILLGAYSTKDLSDTQLKVLSIYGSEDRVLNLEKYAECKANLPLNCVEKIIDGGCHAYFGSYGTQNGDGTPTISNQTQIEITAQAMTALMFSK